MNAGLSTAMIERLFIRQHRMTPTLDAMALVLQKFAKLNNLVALHPYIYPRTMTKWTPANDMSLLVELLR
jgi:hypothetical protein